MKSSYKVRFLLLVLSSYGIGMRKMDKCLIGKFFVIGLLSANPLMAASFDCSKASNLYEKTICSNPNLSSLDDQLAIVYKNARAKSADPEALKKAQIDWIKATRQCTSDTSCIEKAYKDRMAVLSGGSQALAQAHQSTSAKTPSKPKELASSNIPVPVSSNSSVDAMGAVSKNEMGTILAQCWYYWSYVQIAIIKEGGASSKQYETGRNKVELASDLAIKLLGKEMASNQYKNLSRSYRAKRDVGFDINPEIIKGSDGCNNFLDRSDTANAIKRMLNK